MRYIDQKVITACRAQGSLKHCSFYICLHMFSVKFCRWSIPGRRLTTALPWGKQIMLVFFSSEENDFNKALNIDDGMHQLFLVALICKATMVAIVDNCQNGK